MIYFYQSQWRLLYIQQALSSHNRSNFFRNHLVWYDKTIYGFFYKSKKSAFPLKWNWSKEKKDYDVSNYLDLSFLNKINVLSIPPPPPQNINWKMPIQSMNKQSKRIDIGTVTTIIDYLPFTSVLSINIVRHWY